MYKLLQTKLFWEYVNECNISTLKFIVIDAFNPWVDLKKIPFGYDEAVNVTFKVEFTWVIY